MTHAEKYDLIWDTFHDKCCPCENADDKHTSKLLVDNLCKGCKNESEIQNIQKKYDPNTKCLIAVGGLKKIETEESLKGQVECEV